MGYWLFKTEPSTYSFDDLERDKTTTWDGVSNPVALKHLRGCKKGDEVIVYHTGDQRSLIGLARVTKEAYADPKQKNEKLVVVDIQAVRRLKKPVSLADVKARNEFADFALVRLPRLSVMPVNESQWKTLMKMAQEH